ncbi:hypothetical protein ACFLQU_04380 [Verrucomicrobiota bacterium]
MKNYGMILVLLAACISGVSCVGSRLSGGTTKAVAPANAIYDIHLKKADGGGVLHVVLRAERGKFVSGVTVGPLGPTEVDCSGLTLNGNAVNGVLKASIGFDGYYPKDGKPVLHEYRLDAEAADGALRGAFEGAVTPGDKVSGTIEGTLSAKPDLGDYQVIDIQMENASGTGTLDRRSYGARVYPRLFLKDGRFVQSLIYGWGGRVQINYFESAIKANKLTFDGKTLTGSLEVQPTGGAGYVYEFDGDVVGTQIGGMFKKRVDGKEHVGGPFHGRISSVPERPLDQSLYYLELHHAVRRTWNDGKDAPLQLMASVPCIKGRFGSGVAYAAAWNHNYHDIDEARLTLNGNRLTGELKVTLNPDPYMPPDKKPVSASYTIDATVTDGRIISGTYKGRCKDFEVSGPVFGELEDQPPVPEPVSVYMKMEDAVNDGAPWHRRTWVGFAAVNGKADKGSMSNNKGGWQGTFKSAEVKFDGAVFTATIEGTVDKSQRTIIGAYTFKLKGKVIGSQLVGKVDTYRDGKPTKSGTPFMGGFGPVRR